ncbi:efflux RND transporter permease subunit [Cupriavidus basilensis]
MNESFGYAVSASRALAGVFIYMILASQFASFFQPIAILATSLPLTLIGVFAAPLLFRSTLNMFSIIGFIMLMGLVTRTRSCWWTLPTRRSAGMWTAPTARLPLSRAKRH